MKLVDFTNPLLEIVLPKDLMWKDEFSWSPVVATDSYSITGALIRQKGLKIAGRPITLVSPQDMAWISRETLQDLRDWAADPTKKMTLHLEKPTDTRTFTVEFAAGEDVIAETPVRGWTDHDSAEPYQVTIKLTQV